MFLKSKVHGALSSWGQALLYTKSILWKIEVKREGDHVISTKLRDGEHWGPTEIRGTQEGDQLLSVSIVLGFQRVWNVCFCLPWFWTGESAGLVLSVLLFSNQCALGLLESVFKMSKRLLTPLLLQALSRHPQEPLNRKVIYMMRNLLYITMFVGLRYSFTELNVMPPKNRMSSSWFYWPMLRGFANYKVILLKCIAVSWIVGDPSFFCWDMQPFGVGSAAIIFFFPQFAICTLCSSHGNISSPWEPVS